MKIIQTHEFDCRTICDGKRCPHLHPNKDMRLARTIKMFICRDRNMIIMSETVNIGKPNEQILSVGPIQYCIQMRNLQSKGEAQWAEFSIDATGPDIISTHWNPQIKQF